MINLFVGIENQDYLEIHVGSEGCETILNALNGLQTNGKVKINAGMTVAKEGFQIIQDLILKFKPIEHFGDTDCNIWCRKLDQYVEMQLTYLGINELREIIEYVRTSGDHYHFIGGFNLYVTADHKDEIKAINLYMD